MRKIIILSFVLWFFNCKQKPPEPTELYNKYRKSVVLIRNSYYFKTSLDNGFEFYYVIENDKPVFFDNEEDAINNSLVTYGTGFFISNKGEIATNRHVVFPEERSELVSEEIVEFLNELKFKIKKAINENQTKRTQLADLYNEYYDYLDYETKNKIVKEYSNKKNKVIKLEQLLEKLEFNKKNTKTELKRTFLGIAFDDTHVTTTSDFKECVALKKANNEEIDLAIIQLKNKTTPIPETNILSLKSAKEYNNLKLNDKVYMIGFNHGISLAKTNSGIKSQFTQGTITQEPDQNKLLYSIPTLPGSSGSPIIDQWGNLIAINFAKTGDFQGFSFGIPSVYLTTLYNKNFSEVKIENTKKELSIIKEQEKVNTDNFFKKQIRELLEAEDQRDFKAIVKYYDLKNISRYWDIYNPSYDDLVKAYSKSWKTTSNSTNKINSINKIAEKTYDVDLDFKFYNKKTKKWNIINSVVRYVFGINNKIIEVYGIQNKVINKY